MKVSRVRGNKTQTVISRYNYAFSQPENTTRSCVKNSHYLGDISLVKITYCVHEINPLNKTKTDTYIPVFEK